MKFTLISEEGDQMIMDIELAETFRDKVPPGFHEAFVKKVLIRQQPPERKDTARSLLEEALTLWDDIDPESSMGWELNNRIKEFLKK